MQCLILAGGLGTRMPTFTKTMPKSLIPISGMPFAHYQLQLLAENGVTNVIYSIGYLGQQIREFVGDGSQWQIKVEYVDEGEKLLGTGGALRLAYDSNLLEENFFVIYGDSFLPINYKNIWDYFKQNSFPALMTVLKNQNQWDKSNVLFKGNHLLYDKSHPTTDFHHIDYGASIFRKSTVAEYIPSQEKIDLADIFHELSLQNKLSGFEVQQRFFEIGSLHGLADFEQLLKGQHVAQA
jgi:NDP-sugar pyrophosphorylase family protein